MAVVIYTCDTCDREVMIPRNEKGLDHLGRCNITLGCRGKLTQLKILEDYTRGDITEPVSGLDDWYQRKVLHEHGQTVESTDWVINHGFGTEPMVVAFVDSRIEEDVQYEKVPDDIITVDPNVSILQFDEPFSGTAQLIARQSDPDLFKPVEEVEVEEEIGMRITYGTELTLATKISTLGDHPVFRLKLIYLNDDGSSFEVEHLVDDSPAVDSPWNDYDKITTKGKLYTVRSFNFINIEMVNGGRISSGASVYLYQIDSGTGVFRAIEPNDVLILLANDPYKSADKNPLNYIDAADSATNQNSLFYDDGVIYALPDIINNIYPPILPA